MVLLVLLITTLPTICMSFGIDLYDQSRTILDTCNEHCTCINGHSVDKFNKESGIYEKTRMLRIECDGFKSLKMFSIANNENEMIVSSEDENEAQLLFPNGVQVIIHENGPVENVIGVKCTVAGKSDVCFSDHQHNTLKYVTQLYIFGSKEMKNLGIEDLPFLHLLPNLETLHFGFKSDEINIYLFEMVSLIELSFAVRGIVNLYCAYDLDACLSNPNGLQRLNVFYSSPLAAINLHSPLTFPNKISELRVESGHALTEPGDHDVTSIYQNIKFGSVTFTVNHRNALQPIGENDFQGCTVDSVHLEITVHHPKTTEIIKRVYEAGLQSRLKITFYAQSEDTKFPFAYINQQQQLDLSQFDDCPLAKKIFKYREIDLYNGNTVLVIRGFYLKLSEIKRKANQMRTTFASLQEIAAYGYYIEIDQDIEGMDWNKIILYYVDLNVNGDIAAGIKTSTLNREFCNSNGLCKFDYSDLKYQMIQMKHAKESDPLFMIATTTCLISNIADYYKSFQKPFMPSYTRLTKWYGFVLANAGFSSRYDLLEKAHAQHTFKHLIDYALNMEQQHKAVNQVPVLSLETLTENVHVLAQAGRDLQNRMRHFQISYNLKDIQDTTDTNLLTVLNSIHESKIAVLRESKAKSETLGTIETKKQQDIIKSIEESDVFIEQLTEHYETYSTEVKTATADFKKGVKFAMGLAIADAVAEAVGAVLSIFSGGVNPSGMVKAARQVAKIGKIIEKLAKVLEAIKKLIKKGNLMSTLFKTIKKGIKLLATKIPKFFRTQKNILLNYHKLRPDNLVDPEKIKFWNNLEKLQKKIKTSFENINNMKDMVDNTVSYLKAKRAVDMGYDPGNPLEGVTRSASLQLAAEKDILNSFKPGDAVELAENGNSISDIDVFKWDIAREHVISMVDTTLSNDVPEATNYRAALLKFIKAGATRTQAEIDRAVKQAQLGASEHAKQLYFNDAVAAGVNISLIEEKIKKNRNRKDDLFGLREDLLKEREAAELSLDLQQYDIIMELVRLNQEFCNAYYYFHMEKCPENLRLHPTDTIEKVLSIQSMLIYESKQKLGEIYPIPQTFTDKTIALRTPSYCRCITPFQKFKVERSGGRETAIEMAYRTVAECLKNTVTTDDIELTEEVLKNVNDTIKLCTNDPINDVKDNGWFAYEVPIDCSYFYGHDRVRIDDVKAIFDGVTTQNGIVQVLIQSTGVSEDRYKGKCFKFVGQKMMRTFSYYSKKAVASTELDRRRRELTPEMEERFDKVDGMLTKISKKIANLDKDKSIVYIDSANIHKSFQGIFQTPTPFTTFTFYLPPRLNPRLDLSRLKNIRLKFSGSFVTTGLSTPLISCSLKDDDEENGFPANEFLYGG